MSFRSGLFSAVVIVCVVTGCGGSSGPSPIQTPAPTPTGHPTVKPTAPASVSPASPSPTPTPTGSPLFNVSLNLSYTSDAYWQPQSVTVTADGATQSFTNEGIGSGNTIICGLPGAGPTYGCGVVAVVPVGTATFVVRAYPGTITGLPMAVGLATAKIAATEANRVNIAMSGVPAKIAVTVAPSVVVADGTGGVLTGAVTILDSSGNAPLLPTTYADANGNPLAVAITDSDTSGATKVSPTSIAGAPVPVPFQAFAADASTFSIRYNGTALAPASVKAQVGTLGASATLTTQSPPGQHTLYVGSHSGTTAEIDAYPTTANGSAAPTRTITGGLTLVKGLVTDTSGNLYVANQQTSTGTDAVYVYGPSASGNATPIATIAGSNTQLAYPIGIARDTSGTIYVLNAGTSTGGQYVTTYPAGSNGNVTPSNEIAGPLAELGGALAIAVDASSNVYVSLTAPNGPADALLLFAAGSFGNVAPTADLEVQNPLGAIAAGPGGALYGTDGAFTYILLPATSGTLDSCIQLPYSGGGRAVTGGIAVDAASEIFSGINAPNEVVLNPNEPPIGTYSGARSCFALAPYRALTLPASRTVDTVAVGP